MKTRAYSKTHHVSEPVFSSFRPSFGKQGTPFGKPGTLSDSFFQFPIFWKTGYRIRETGYPFRETGDDRFRAILGLEFKNLITWRVLQYVLKIISSSPTSLGQRPLIFSFYSGSISMNDLFPHSVTRILGLSCYACSMRLPRQVLCRFTVSSLLRIRIYTSPPPITLLQV